MYLIEDMVYPSSRLPKPCWTKLRKTYIEYWENKRRIKSQKSVDGVHFPQATRDPPTRLSNPVMAAHTGNSCRILSYATMLFFRILWIYDEQIFVLMLS